MKVEPWLARYQRALRRRREPQVYLLVSWIEAEALAAGNVPPRVTRQARQVVTWQPTTRKTTR